MSPLRRARRSLREWRDLAVETVRLTHDSVAAHPLRSILAVLGIVIGIVTVVLVASILANVRNSVAAPLPGARHRERLRLPPLAATPTPRPPRRRPAAFP